MMMMMLQREIRIVGGMGRRRGREFRERVAGKEGCGEVRVDFVVFRLVIRTV